MQDLGIESKCIQLVSVSVDPQRVPHKKVGYMQRDKTYKTLLPLQSGAPKSQVVSLFVNPSVKL